ncbi:hypothetical protein BGW37DRAFT_541907 [Umbelopsis sp. PMI_123]|nr:hypothetical protein BGW37DRAFT_541907 [Umbelopsis sp. PMI_123]
MQFCYSNCIPNSSALQITITADPDNILPKAAPRAARAAAHLVVPVAHTNQDLIPPIRHLVGVVPEVQKNIVDTGLGVAAAEKGSLHENDQNDHQGAVDHLIKAYQNRQAIHQAIQKIPSLIFGLDDRKRQQDKRSKKSKKDKKHRSRRRRSHSSEEDRRNPITGKKIKLKVHKTSDDKNRDSNRSQLLQFLNSTF